MSVRADRPAEGPMAPANDLGGRRPFLWEPDEGQWRGHVRHVCVAMALLAVLTGTVFLANRQWLLEYQLGNSPGYDALVYQNQSYDDYLLVRGDGPWGIVRKYTDGRWHVPPLYMLGGTCAYLLFGTNPANFYIVPAVSAWLLLWAVYGIAHYFTRDALAASIATAMVAVVPSVVEFGLRVSQIDFTAGCVFTLATYLLVLSGGLRKPWVSAAYAATVGVAFLLKSSLVPYFLAHVVLWMGYVWLEPAKRPRRLLGAAIAVLVIGALSGWFFLANWRQITAYYTKWGTVLSHVSRAGHGLTGPADDAVFYVRSLYSFHLHRTGFCLYAWAVLIAVALFASARRGGGTPVPEARYRWGLTVVCIWLLVPYVVLSCYPSKSYPVDFPFLAAWFVAPVLAATAAGRNERYRLALLAGFLPFLLFGGATQLGRLVSGAPTACWREQEVLGAILRDAEARGLPRVVVSNSFVDRFLTSENLRFFVLNGTYASWRGRYSVAPLDYYTEPAGFFRALAAADYVLTRVGGAPLPRHPDNELTSAVNGMLFASADFVEIGRYGLPDLSEAIVLRNEGRRLCSYAGVSTDGWITAPFRVDLYGPIRDALLVIKGRMPLPDAGSYPAQMVLRNDGGQLLAQRTVEDAESFALSVPIRASWLERGAARTTFWLDSPSAFRPRSINQSDDDRRLLMILGDLSMVSEDSAAVPPPE